MVVVKCLGRRIRVKYLAGLCLGFAIGILFVNLVLGKHSMTYKEGFEAGKNYVPASMKRADSLSVVYYGNMPMVSNQIKMPRDSVQLIIDSFMGKPRQYLLMTLKLVTKEKE